MTKSTINSHTTKQSHTPAVTNNANYARAFLLQADLPSKQQINFPLYSAKNTKLPLISLTIHRRPDANKRFGIYVGCRGNGHPILYHPLKKDITTNWYMTISETFPISHDVCKFQPSIWKTMEKDSSCAKYTYTKPITKNNVQELISPTTKILYQILNGSLPISSNTSYTQNTPQITLSNKVAAFLQDSTQDYTDTEQTIKQKINQYIQDKNTKQIFIHNTNTWKTCPKNLITYNIASIGDVVQCSSSEPQLPKVNAKCAIDKLFHFTTGTQTNKPYKIHGIKPPTINSQNSADGNELAPYYCYAQDTIYQRPHITSQPTSEQKKTIPSTCDRVMRRLTSNSPTLNGNSSSNQNAVLIGTTVPIVLIMLSILYKITRHLRQRTKRHLTFRGYTYNETDILNTSDIEEYNSNISYADDSIYSYELVATTPNPHNRQQNYIPQKSTHAPHTTITNATTDSNKKIHTL